MHVRLTQIDGNLPNLALMKLARWHAERGDTYHFTRQTMPDLAEYYRPYDRVYGSAIFAFSADKVARFKATWPNAILGGTGSHPDPSHPDRKRTVADMTGAGLPENFYDYSITRDYDPSIGFTQRGCRLSCKFCVVPGKEGPIRSVGTIAEIWRGQGHPKKLHLLDNDFFGQPDWRARVDEMRSGGFKVCLNQGINVRHITPEAAAAMASIEYRDDAFQKRRLYTAWDNLKDERVFFDGMDMLEAAGIPAKHVMAYMLVGYDKNETWERIWHRFNAMVARGIQPYPMVFDCRAKDPGRYRELKRLQRWVVTGLYRAVPFTEYDAGMRAGRGPDARQFEMAA